MDFFETNKPYEIAALITSGNELTHDLVAHVYLIMQGKEIEDKQKYFSRCAYQQYNWKNSEFNRLMYGREFKQADEKPIDSTTEEVITNERYKECLNIYLNKEPKDMVEWYYKEMTLMYLDGMTYDKIVHNTGLSKRTVVKTLKKIKDDIFNLYNSNSVKSSVYEYSLHKD